MSGDASLLPSFPRKRESMSSADAPASPSFPRKRESILAAKLDARFRGHDANCGTRA
jgi:hypothetical protein